MQGKVNKIMTHRGFGFITVVGRKDDIFFHRSSLQGQLDFDRLREGQPVEFEIENSPKGQQAVNITAA